MTCIIGWVDGNRVFLAADSAGSSGDEIYRIPTEKVFTRGPYLFGVCGSYQVRQVLRYHAALPTLPESGNLEAFLVRELSPAIAKAMKEAGVFKEDPVFLGDRVAILLGCRGRLWHLDPHLTVLAEERFGAIGSGHLRAYAALHALERAGVEPSKRRAELALEAAAEYTSTVRPPWQFVSLDR